MFFDVGCPRVDIRTPFHTIARGRELISTIVLRDVDEGAQLLIMIEVDACC